MKYARGFYDIFMQTCSKHPSRAAVVYYDEQNSEHKVYTYSELYGVCEYISQTLQSYYIKGMIGVITERNIIVPCIAAASHKCSTSFMFLDPTKDVEVAANEMKFSIIIHITKIDICFDSVGKRPDKTIVIFDYKIHFYTFNCNITDDNYKEILEYSFIAMTSGSTGEPKKIQVPMQCILPNINDLSSMFNIVPEDVIYFSTPLTFDPSMVEILLACMNGACLLIAPCQSEILFKDKSLYSVTIWQTTPSKFFQCSNSCIKRRILSKNSSLKILALGGEPLTGVIRLKELKDPDNKTKIFTLYGVTEMSCWACATQLELNKIMCDREVPLGACLSQTDIKVESGPNHKKDTGNIVLVSKTRRCVVLNRPSSPVNSFKYIHTGDMAEVKNGTIYYRGRQDDIIKRFGRKINLQYIECTVMQCPKVSACSCVWIPKPRILVVYFSSNIYTSRQLSDFLKCKLDESHWPDKVIRVDNLPINKHEKISKQILAEKYTKESHKTSKQAQESLKFTLLQELKQLLHKRFTYEDIKHKNFYSLGGTSFLAITMCNRIAESKPELGRTILPLLLTPKYTINEVLAKVREEGNMEKEKSQKIIRKSSEKESDNRVSSTQPSKSVISNISLEIILMWSQDTGKCVDAPPTLCRTLFNLYVAVGSHSGKVVVVDGLTGVLHGTLTAKARIEAPIYCFLDKATSVPYGIVGTYDGTILCFALENCDIIWQLCIHSMVKSRAVMCKGQVYVAAYDGVVRCIDVKIGEIIQAIYICDRAISADLVVAQEEYIIVATLSGLCACIYGPTNTVVWSVSLQSPVFASPVLYDNEKYTIFAEVSGKIHCKTLERGLDVWNYEGAKGNVFSSIYITEIEKMKWQFVFGCHDNHVYSVTLNNFQPKLQWKTQLSSPVYATPCSLEKDYILTASNNGIISVLDAKTGSILTEYALPNESFSSPAVYTEYIFVGCRDDNLYGLRFISNTE